MWVPHWILFSLGIPCSVDFLSFSNFHIIWSIKFIFGDIWWLACLVFQFGSFLKSSEGNSVVLLHVHCCLYFCQSLCRVFDGPLLQIAQGMGSKYRLCWFTSRNLSLGMTSPYFAGQALAVEHSQKLPSLCREQCLTWPPPCSVHLLGHKVFVGPLSWLDFVIIPGGNVPLRKVFPLILSYSTQTQPGSTYISWH